MKSKRSAAAAYIQRIERELEFEPWFLSRNPVSRKRRLGARPAFLAFHQKLPLYYGGVCSDGAWIVAWVELVVDKVLIQL